MDAADDSASQARLRLPPLLTDGNLPIHRGVPRQRRRAPATVPSDYAPSSWLRAKDAPLHSCKLSHTHGCHSPSIFSAFMIVSVGFISTAAVMTIGSMWLIDAASLLSSHQKENTHTGNLFLWHSDWPFLSDLQEIIN